MEVDPLEAVDSSVASYGEEQTIAVVEEGEALFLLALEEAVVVEEEAFPGAPAYYYFAVGTAPDPAVA